MRARAVTLDAAGTLIAVAEPVGATYARLAAAHGIIVDPQTLTTRFPAAIRAAGPLARPDLAAHPGQSRAWWRQIAAETLGPTAAAASGFSACFDALWAHYASALAWQVFPDALPVLRALRTAGVRLAVVSNFDARLPPLLAELGVAPLLDAVVHSSAVGAEKPAASIFTAALTILDVSGHAAVHVGDDPGADVDGAIGAGLRAVLLDRTGQATSAHPRVPTIATLAELPELLGIPQP